MARAVAIYLKRGNCSMLPLSNLNDSSKGGIRNSANHLALPMGHYRLHLLFSLEHGTASHAMFHSQSSCFANSHIMRENWTSTHRQAGPAGFAIVTDEGTEFMGSMVRLKDLLRCIRIRPRGGWDMWRGTVQSPSHVDEDASLAGSLA